MKVTDDLTDLAKDNSATLPIAGLTVARVNEIVDGEYFGPAEALGREVTGLEINSRQIVPGNIFAAFVGEKVDGNKFIENAAAAGAAVTLSEKGPNEIASILQKDATTVSNLPIIKVDDVAKAVEKIAIYRRQLLSIPVVAIIGSVGKTSTKEAIANVLTCRFNVLKTSGNLNNELGLPMTIMCIKDCHDVAVLEMGISDFGEMSVLANIARPNVLVFTNVCDCHLETLGDKAGVLRAKSEAFNYLHDKRSVAILNGDDEYLSNVRDVAGRRPVFFGINNGCDKKNARDDKDAVNAHDNYVSDLVALGLRGSKGILHLANNRPAAGKGEITVEDAAEDNVEDIAEVNAEVTAEFELPLPGLHSVYNMLAAASVGNHLGMSLPDIIEGIFLSKNIAGHGAIIALPTLTILDESYNANPESMRASLNLLESCDTRKVAILGDMAELGPGEKEIHRELGRFISTKKIDTVVAIGSLSKNIVDGIMECSENKDYADNKDRANNQVSGAKVNDSIATANTPQTLYFDSVDKFLAQVRTIVKNGDSVLVKASHSMNFAKIVESLKNFR